MSDPLKKFVDQNREAFDHKEPPAAVLANIKSRLNNAATGMQAEYGPGNDDADAEAQPADLNVSVERKTFPLFGTAGNFGKWIAAAAVLIVVSITFVYDGKEKATDQVVHRVNIKNIPVLKDSIEQQVAVVNKPAEARTESETSVKHQSTHKASMPQAIKVKAIIPAPVYAGLADSTSASMRLAAILEIGKQNKIQNNTLNSLANILNNDANSNVRLAALDVMGSYVKDGHVSSLLVKSLATQNDPLVQLGLINLLSKVENVQIDDRLFALAEDPNTLDAVKAEAYGILLNQNKL